MTNDIRTIEVTTMVHIETSDSDKYDAVIENLPAGTFIIMSGSVIYMTQTYYTMFKNYQSFIKLNKEVNTMTNHVELLNSHIKQFTIISEAAIVQEKDYSQNPVVILRHLSNNILCHVLRTDEGQKYLDFVKEVISDYLVSNNHKRPSYKYYHVAVINELCRLTIFINQYCTEQANDN